MAFGSFDNDDEVMSEINMTPLVDVMLVLLIIFIITIPVINHAVKIDLPRASNKPDDAKPQSVNVEIDAQGQVFWNNQPVDEATLQADIEKAAQQQPQPEMHLRADRSVRYERVAQVMAAIQRGGLARIGFVTEPQRN
ncbi:ExbD/TolR family protein [Ralstonia sp. 25C]|uniref:ExbD/TolR family protein n=1 Tax=unclassified Ralstonia TaxID=209769 RepID=UPI003CF26186